MTAEPVGRFRGEAQVFRDGDFYWLSTWAQRPETAGCWAATGLAADEGNGPRGKSRLTAKAARMNNENAEKGCGV